MNSNRRSFLKYLGGTVSAMTAAQVFLSGTSAIAAEERRAKKADAKADSKAGGGDLALPFVKVGEGMAKTVNYVEKKADIKDAALKADRQGVKFEKQDCAGCMLYTKVGNKDGGEAGKCTLFAGNLVKGTSWCSTWAKKA